MRSNCHRRVSVCAWAATVIGYVAGLLVLVAPTLAAELRLGTAAVKITPPNGTPKRPVLTYVNFADHLDTTGGTRISADFPTTLAQRLADYRGPDMLTIFANGACGNINHVVVRAELDACGTSKKRLDRTPSHAAIAS
jgi:hypothetical protein